MEQRLSVVTLGVANLGRACDFYERGLGWRRGNAGDEIAFYQLDGMILALYPRAALAEDAGLPNEPARFGGITLAYNTRDKAEVEAVLDQATAAGATVLRPAQEVFWGGYSGIFADPDGHPWEVAWNPHWSLTEAGAVQLKG
jgi:catechol 2,3-dioxygenase-like lactoylglutathione lyase family enzyme